MSAISPESNASFFRRLYFSWAFPTLREGRARPLTVETLLPLRSEESPERSDEAFQAAFASNRNAKRPVLLSVWQLERRELLKAFFVSMLHLAALVLNPIILRELIHWLGNSSGSTPRTGYLLAGSLVVVSLIGSIAVHHMFQIVLRMMIRVRVPLVAIIYRKCLRLTLAARHSTSSGQIINLMGTDAQKFVNAINLIFSIWFHPMQLCLSLAALYWILGVPSLVGVLVLAVTFLISLRISRKQVRIREKLMKFTDARVALMNEILMSMRMIKFYSWEASFVKEVQGVRSQELGELTLLARCQAITSLIFLSTPVVVAFATFTTIVLSGKGLDVADVFSALAFFTLLRHAMLMLPDVATAAIEANVALKRVETFLALPEIPTTIDAGEETGTVFVQDAAWEWGPGVLALSKVHLSMSRGQLFCLVGAVGTGKSAFFQGILGEIPLVAGTAKISGKIGYIPQQAWIQNDSIRNNILFGLPFNAERYERIVAACALTDDFAELHDGDRTEIGERGINLSGGQKQRISLARAAYAEADIYLFDDPLSALDSKVAAHVYRELICGILKEKTRILATHRLEFVDGASEVLVFHKGNIVERGTPRAVREGSGAFGKLWEVHQGRVGAEMQAALEGEAPPLALLHSEAELPHDNADEGDSLELTASPTRQLVVTEERFSGVVSPEVYRAYLRLFSPLRVFLILATIFVLKELLNVGSDGWLAWWSTSTFFRPTTFVTGFALLGLGACLSIYIRSLLISLQGLVAGRELHNRLLKSILHAPMSFFEENPVGRILNRFSRDLEAIDLTIPRTLHEVAGCAFSIISTVIVIGVVSPIAMLGLLPVVYCYLIAQSYYRPASREGQRLDSITRSPIFAQFSESLVGVSVLRAFSALPRFEKLLLSRLETNSRTFYTMFAANRWLGTRIETLGAAVVGSAAFASVYLHRSTHLGFTGMSVTYALAVTGAMNWAIRMFSQLESNMNSVERVEYYSALTPELWDGNSAPAEWPSRGEIRFEELELRYRPELPAVVSNLSATIRAGEKIGIVGRTGSGKSSLLLGLYRMLEPSAGRILIDGQETSKLSLREVREALAIIPQDPTLFRGTIRKNLDPFASHSDEKLWDVLERAHLRSVIESLPLRLESSVSEGGTNLSVGQRQLLCLARALLRKNRILVLDEATANVDVATDALVQCTIREAFSDCTVLTVAHRLSTILDSDRIMVLEQGRLAEFDSPHRLAQSKSALLRSLLRESAVQHQ